MLRTIVLFVALFIAACGAAPSSSENIESTDQALLVPLTMFVQPGTLQMVPPRGRVSEDLANPTPNLTLVTVIESTCTSQYSTTAKQAILCVTIAQFNTLNADLAQWGSLGKKTRVDLTYDTASSTGTTKAITSFAFSTF